MATAKRNPSLLEKKCLAAIMSMGERSYSLNDAGILALLAGDSSMAKFEDNPVYGSMTSLKGKKCKNALRNLLHHDYVYRRYQKEEGEYYYFLSPLGEEVAEAYLKKPHAKRGKQEKTTAKLYVSLDEFI